MYCKECGQSLDEIDFDIGEIIECPKCKTKHSIEYEETFDGEEESQYLWAEKIEE